MRCGVFIDGRLQRRHLCFAHHPFLRERFYGPIAQEANDQKARQDVQRDVINGCARHPGRNFGLTDVIHDHGADNARRGPCGQEASMNGANELRPKNIGEISRHGGESAAIHRDDDAEKQNENRNRTGMRHGWSRGIQKNANDKKCVIGVLPADNIRQRCPKETSADIEQRQQTGEAGRDCRNGGKLPGIKRCKRNFRFADQAASKDFLKHGRSDAEHSDARRNIQAQHGPDQPELFCPVRVTQMDLTVGDHRRAL